MKTLMFKINKIKISIEKPYNLIEEVRTNLLVSHPYFRGLNDEQLKNIVGGMNYVDWCKEFAAQSDYAIHLKKMWKNHDKIFKKN